MAYIYHVSFDIDPAARSELEIGASLERIIGYLRVLLPSEEGHIESRAASTVDDPGKVHVVLESTWLDWDNVMHHRQSQLAEQKVLQEFQPEIELRHLTQRVLREID